MNVTSHGNRILLALVSSALFLAAPANASAYLDQFLVSPSARAPSCTQDGLWCISASKEEMTVLSRSASGKLVERARLPLAKDEDLRIETTPWNRIIRNRQDGRPEQVLVGTERRQSESYSGGGGSVTELQLFGIGAGPVGSAKPALSVPLASSFMIRACFTQEDEKARRGACHDEYSFAGELDVARSRRSGEVSLLFKGRAETYPGPRNRAEDSTMEAPLRKSDLVWALNAKCTFQRYIRWLPSTGSLSWSRPLPACEDFLQLQ